MAKGTSRYGLLILATVCMTYFTENFLRAGPSALSPILIEEFGLTHGVAGLLFSSYFFLYALLQIPSGILSDTLGPRRTIIGFTVFTVIGTVLFYMARSLGLLIAAQLLMGLGSSVFYINAVRMISDWFPQERRASAIGVLSASSGVGNFAAYMGFPLAMTYLGGWRTLYLYCAVLMVVNLVANFLIVRNSPDGVNHVQENGNTSILHSLKTVLKDRRLYPFLVSYALLGLFWMFMTWLPQWLTDTRGITYIEVGLVSSAGTITGIPGCILIGVISDRLRKRKLPLVVFYAASTIALIALILMPVGTPPVVYAVLAGVLGFTLSAWVLLFSMVPETLPPEVAGVGMGIVNGIGTLAFSVMNPIYGYLVDITGSYFASNAMVVVAGIALVVVSVLFLKETYGGANGPS
jgi:nitrate/nitrite transporter NarK